MYTTAGPGTSSTAIVAAANSRIVDRWGMPAAYPWRSREIIHRRWSAWPYTPRVTITLGRDGAIAEILLNRPDKLNAMNLDWVRELADAVSELAADPPRVVVIRGAGRAFCSGLDLDMMGEHGMPPE